MAWRLLAVQRPAVSVWHPLLPPLIIFAGEMTRPEAPREQTHLVLLSKLRCAGWKVPFVLGILNVLIHAYNMLRIGFIWDGQS